DVVVDRCAEEDDPLVEQHRVDVEEALAAGGLLDVSRDDEIRRPQLRAAHSPGVQSFVSVGGFSLSGVQIASRASACALGIGLTSAATRASARRTTHAARSVSTH